MQPCRRWAYTLLLGAGLLTLGEWGLSQWLPQVLVYAPSPSLPQGWYVRVLPAHPLQVGDVVSLWTPVSLLSRMPPNMPPYRMLKRIAGLGGMEVCWTPGGMQVGGKEYLRHPTVHVEPELRGCAMLAQGAMIIVGDHPRSMDSRYIGAVPVGLVRFQVRPLWTWKGTK
jgi:type IV secretory pathway protease TraF